MHPQDWCAVQIPTASVHSSLVSLGPRPNQPQCGLLLVSLYWKQYTCWMTGLGMTLDFPDQNSSRRGSKCLPCATRVKNDFVGCPICQKHNLKLECVIIAQESEESCLSACESVMLKAPMSTKRNHIGEEKMY